jgi:hypothetical protein
LPTATWASGNFAAGGDPEQAQERLTTPMAMYREMGTTYWLELGQFFWQNLPR